MKCLFIPGVYNNLMSFEGFCVSHKININSCIAMKPRDFQNTSFEKWVEEEAKNGAKNTLEFPRRVQEILQVVT